MVVGEEGVELEGIVPGWQVLTLVGAARPVLDFHFSSQGSGVAGVQVRCQSKNEKTLKKPRLFFFKEVRGDHPSCRGEGKTEGRVEVTGQEAQNHRNKPCWTGILGKRMGTVFRGRTRQENYLP